MSHFEQNQQQKRNGNVKTEADYVTDQYDCAAITQQWLIKCEKYSIDKSIPPPPPPPNISYTCYFDERIPDECEINDGRAKRTPLSPKTKNVDQTRNDGEPLNAVKIEPNTAPNGENRMNASSISKGNYTSTPLISVKVEPEEEPASRTESSLYYDAFVQGARSPENVSRRDFHYAAKIEAEPATTTLLRTNNPALGYNIYIENTRNGTLASSFESVSNELSSNDSQYWLPILSSIDDWSYIKGEFMSTVDRVCTRIHCFGFGPEKVFKVCSSLMNSAVVKIMENGRNGADNTAYINGFFSIYRILNQYAQNEDELIKASNRALTNFMTWSAARVKQAVPNLGEFLMHLTVSTQWKWTQISKVFMDELDTRNVFWYCIGNHNSPAAHPELANVNQYRFDRETKVFHATTISRNLVMFQVKFANMTKSMEFTEFCTNFGRVQDILTAKLKNLYSTVIAINDWDQYYDFLQMPRVSLAKRNNDLARAVTRSAAQGYHKRPASAMRRGDSKKRRMR